MSAFISLASISWSTPDGRAVLSDIALTFQRERTGIVGRNGAGKSTLLKLVSGRLAPMRGQVMVEGTIDVLRQMAQVSAGTASIDELAEADWTLEARAAEALARVGLSAALDTAIARLSGGQRTRAALAGALSSNPILSCSTSPPTTSTATGAGRCASFSKAGARARWS